MDDSTKRLIPKSNIRLFAVLLLFFSAQFLSAQDAPKFNVKVKFSVQQGGMENSLITITRDGASYRVIDPNKGKYSVDLELGSEYVLTFTKPGHITKAVVIDTHVPGGREKEDFAKFIAEVGLEMQPEDQIITYSQPVGKIKYSVQSGDFDFDKDYTQTATEAQKKDKENAKPKPKEPTPVAKPATPPPVAKPIPVSNPEPVVIKQPEYKPEPEKRKPPVVEPETPPRPVVKNKVERTIQEDRRKITIVTVTIDGVDYIYKREEYNWGGLYFYRDGKNITQSAFDKETE